VTGSSRGEQLVTGQQVQVVLGPLEHVPLLVVVRDQGNPPPCGRCRVLGNASPPPTSASKARCPGWLRTPPGQMSCRPGWLRHGQVWPLAGHASNDHDPGKT
jgi:hypothetical protein